MWFINDISIRKIEKNEGVVLKVCNENNFKIGSAWYRTKLLGWIILDEDYPRLIKLLNERKNEKGRIGDANNG